MKITLFLIVIGLLVSGCKNAAPISLIDETQISIDSTNIFKPVVVVSDNFAQSASSYELGNLINPGLLVGNLRVDTIYTTIKVAQNRSYVITYATLLKESTLLMKLAVETGRAQDARNWAEMIHFLQVSRELEEAKELTRAGHAQFGVTK